MGDLLDAGWVSQVRDEQISRAVGSATAARGAGYAASGHVVSASAAGGGDVLVGMVQGSRVKPYRVVVTRTGSVRGSPSWVSRCSCPVGSECKHSVALLRVVRDWLAGRLDDRTMPPNLTSSQPGGNIAYLMGRPRPGEAAPPSRDGHPAYRNRDAPGRRPAPGEPADWESVIRGLVDPAPPGRTADTGALCGIVVDVVTRFDGSPRERVSERLRIRPVRQTKTGRWAKNPLAWSDIAMPPAAHPLREAHRLVLAEIYALHRGSPAGYTGYGTPELLLDDLGPGVWPLLRRAAAAGITLLAAPADPASTPAPGATGGSGQAARGAARSAGVVRLADEPVEILLDLRRDDLGLVLTPRVLGAQWQESSLLVGGTSAAGGAPGYGRRSAPRTVVHGVARFSGDDLWLAPLAKPLDPRIGEFVRATGPLRIPAADIDRFLAFYYPALSRHARVTSLDESIELPELVPPRLLVRVRMHSARRLTLELAILYPGQEKSDVVVSLGVEGAAVPRDRDAESRMLERVDLLDEIPGLRRIGPAGATTVTADHVEVTGMAAVDFATRLLPALQRQDDVVVDLVGDLSPYRESEAEPVVRLDAVDASHGRAAGGATTDWFDLQVTVELDGEEVPFRELFAALARDDEALVLDSGTWFRLDRPELDRLRTLIEEARELGDQRHDGLRITPSHLGLWDDLVDLGVVQGQSARWSAAVQAVRSAADPTVVDPPPAGLQAQLRDYQLRGYTWLSRLWEAGLGGILADDMGLGKTLQALAAVARAANAGDLTAPVLVVAPTSVVPTWLREAARFTPDLRVVGVTESERRRSRPLGMLVAGADLVVTSYALLRIDDALYRGLTWRAVILDEAQFVKNHRAKTYVAVRRLGAPLTIAMTGTPLENSLMDLWSLLSLVAPGLYPRPEAFTQVYRRPIESGAAPEQLDRLRRRIRPLMLRRTKSEVATELPAKQEQVVSIPLHPAHATVYQRHLQRERQRILGLLEEPDPNRVAILSSLTRLRQLSLHPGLVDEGYLGTSAKIDGLVDHLAEIQAEGHRALVFSQFTRFLRMVRDRLTEEGVPWCYLDGRTKDRAGVVEEFRSGDAAAFLISLKAGGFGLTLTEADYVFVLDPWWNPAAEIQAIDRAHRIGQTRTVMVYRFVSADTVEEKVVAMQQRKRELFESVVDEGGFGEGGFSAQDIRDLLTPERPGDPPVG